MNRENGTTSPKGGPAIIHRFRPLPLLGNPHIQTMLAQVLPGDVRSLPAAERHVVLPDGDRLVLHDSRPARWRSGDPIAVLVHGLGGCHASLHLVRQGHLLMRHGVRAVRLDLRGVGRGERLARGTYNAASSDDVRRAAEAVCREHPNSPLWLVGFSLGGNIVLKLAGEAASLPLPGLSRVAAVSPPIDMVRCAALMSLPRNRIYERYYMRLLTRQVRRHDRHFPDLPRVRFPRNLTLPQFDNLYTAPRGGFRDATDYYERSASLPLIPQIRVPTFILTARDDPFISVEAFERLGGERVAVHIANRGGHMGFLGPDGAGGIRWAERRVEEWLIGDLSAT
jgi:predicted alpha/beta-fold hydrolase